MCKKSGIGVTENASLNYVRIQSNLLSQAAMSRCESFPMFLGLILSLICWRTVMPEKILLSSFAAEASRLVLRDV